MIGRSFLAWVSLSSLCAAIASSSFGCGSSGGDEDGTAEGGGSSAGGSVFGDARPSGSRDAAERIATRAVDAVVSSCGSSCSADVSAGYERLGEGHMLEAWNAFKCADTPEAAFGAGIARVLGVLESEAGDRIMGDLGLPELPASDLFGANGWLARASARWNGSAQLSTSGGLELVIDSKHVMADDWALQLKTDVGTKRITLEIETDEQWSAGTLITSQYDCANGGRNLAAALPFLSLDVRDGADEYDCQVPFSLTGASCVPSGGSLRVVASGQKEADHVELELSDLLLQCTHYTDSAGGTDQVQDVQPIATRLSGKIMADVMLEIDTSDLHPIFQNQDDLLLRTVGGKVTTTAFMNHAAAVAGEIASARCYFDKAAQGSGTVFTLPGALYGGQDLALSAGDARMLASASGLAAATLELSTSYELDQSLRQVVCALADGLDGQPMCPGGQEFVTTFNASMSKARVRYDRVSAARALLQGALEDFDQGAGQVGEQSALARNAVSDPGWRSALELAHAALASLSAGATVVPHLEPTAHVDLDRLFASPPDPSAIVKPPLSYSRECEDLGGGMSDCYDNLDLDTGYVNAFFAAHSDIDWSGDYEWHDDGALSDAVEEVIRNVRDKGLELGE